MSKIIFSRSLLAITKLAKSKTFLMHIINGGLYREASWKIAGCLLLLMKAVAIVDPQPQSSAKIARLGLICAHWTNHGTP